mmetsp:Transcript_9966/g.14668  ORF Transcript_9966/g.14668 Transcript_9966/m.14668 type:complete len:209 (+) Transcript_9966:155-781(+)
MRVTADVATFTAILCYSSKSSNSFIIDRKRNTLASFSFSQDVRGDTVFEGLDKHSGNHMGKKWTQMKFASKSSSSIDSSNSDEPQVSQSFTLKQRNPYDVHVYYNGPDEHKIAMALREKMQEKFQWMRFYNPKDRPIGPHPVPMWEADFGSYEHRDKLSEVRDFIEEEHGDLSVLIHPHSLDGDYADHTKHAFWAGEILELRIAGWEQ